MDIRADVGAVEAEWESQQQYLEAGWTLKWNPRLRRRNGRCFYVIKLIDLATFLTTEEAIEILKHEVAHAICSNLYLSGKARSHGPQWAEICVKVMGIEPRVTMKAKYAPPPEPFRWYLECPSCSFCSRLFQRRPRKPRICPGCGGFMSLHQVPTDADEIQALAEKWASL